MLSNGYMKKLIADRGNFVHFPYGNMHVCTPNRKDDEALYYIDNSNNFRKK
jgi:hypothetical protein